MSKNVEFKSNFTRKRAIVHFSDFDQIQPGRDLCSSQILKEKI